MGPRPGGLSGPGVRAVLIGTGIHGPGALLPPLPAVGNTVRRLGAALIDTGGMSTDSLRVVVDPADPMELGRELTAAASEASQVLLVYYVGHGLISPGGELHLATRATVDLNEGLAAYQALPFSALCDAVANCAARCVVVILDCCHAGRASANVARLAGGSFESVRSDGGFLLVAVGRSELAQAPLTRPDPVFTGNLLRLLTEGDPAGPPWLTLDHAWRYLSRVLPEQQAPRPHRRTADRAGELVLAPNPAYVPPTTRERGGTADDDALLAAMDVCPWPGLRPYQAQDRAYFHGRDRLIAHLVDRAARRLEQPGPLMVVGASGAGKSSLLRAGLIAALADGALPGSEAWPALVLTPGTRPLDALTAKLADGTGRAGPLDRRFVLIVDQLEELFVDACDPLQRQEFIAALMELATSGPADDASSAPLVVVGLRADFYGHCAAWPGLHAALEDWQVVVGPMTSGELREVIDQSASDAGLALEDGLVDLLIEDLSADEPAGMAAGRLPLLSHALLTTWQRREGRLLTLAGYRATGGIRDAIARTATDTYTALDGPGQAAARRLLLRLVTVGVGAPNTRRRGSLAELTGDGDAASRAALTALVAARLVTVDGPVAEITHEALLVYWPQLQQWIDDDRTELLLRQRLADDANAWHHSGRDDSFLYRRARLDAAQQVVRTGGPLGGLTSIEMDFLHASARHQRRGTRRLYQVIAGLAVLLLLTMAAGLFALQQRDAARRDRGLAVEQMRAAISRQLAAQADATRAAQPVRALELALEALNVAETPQARASLLTTVTQVRRPPAAAGDAGAAPPCPGCNVSPQAVATADGRLLAVAGVGDTTVDIWDLSREDRPVRRAVLNHESAITALAFSPNGDYLATASRHPEHTVRVFRVSRFWIGPEPPTTTVLFGHTPVVTGLAFGRNNTLAIGQAAGQVTLYRGIDGFGLEQTASFSTGTGSVTALATGPDGSTLAVGGGDGTVRLWDITDGAHPAETAILTGHTAPVLAVAVDASTVATASADHTARLWNITDGAHPAETAILTGHTAPVLAVAVDASTVATASADHTARLWNITDRAHPTPTATLPAHDGPIPGLAFTGHGSRLVTASADHTAKVWDITDRSRPTATAVVLDRTAMLWQAAAHALPTRLADLVGHTGDVLGAAFSPDGRTVATASADQTVQLWGVADPAHPVRGPTLTGHTGPVHAIAYAKDMIVTGGADHTARVWNVADIAHPAPGAILTGHTGPVLSVAARDGYVATGGADNTVRFWQATGELLDDQPPSQLAAINGIAFVGRSSTAVVAAVADHTARRWTPPWGSRGGSWTDLAGHSGPVLSVATAASSDIVATGSADNTVILWDASQPRSTATLLGHAGPVHAVAFSPVGGILATASADRTTMLWETSDPTRPINLTTLTRQQGPVLTVAFSPNGRTLVTAGAEHIATLWNLSNLLDTVGNARAVACGIVGPGPERSAWRRLVPPSADYDALEPLYDGTTVCP